MTRWSVVDVDIVTKVVVIISRLELLVSAACRVQCRMA